MIKTTEFKNKTGNTIKVVVEITREVRTNVAYADGLNIETGKEAVESMNIKIYKDGSLGISTSWEPSIVTRESYVGSYDRIKANGGYARLGDTYISEEIYNVVVATIENCKATLDAEESAEYIELKAKETAKKIVEIAEEKKADEKMKEMIKSGYCPKCGTWCYGECEQ